MSNKKEVVNDLSLASLIKKAPSENTEALREAIEAIFSSEHIATKSVITPQQVSVLAAGKVYAKHYNSPLIDLLCTSLLELSISQKGRGRDDLVKALQSVLQKQSEEETSIRKRLLGI